jgi:hypothetical protein
MTLTEKRAWCLLAATLGAYTWYVVTVLNRADGGPVQETPYATTLLWSLGASIVFNIGAEIVFSIFNPRGARTKDERDRTIDRLGDQVGQSFVVIGGVSALFMALAEWDWFWIANALYLGFALSAVLGCVAKIVMNHAAIPNP